MPKVTINGQTVEVPQGTTVIQAAQKLNIPIAHYCWHEGLSVAGVCRMCLVEVEKNPKLQIACNTPVTDGMVVHTDSEKAKDAVRWSLDFHLINHPLDCPICDQAGECKLQDYYMTYGLYNPEMDKRKVKKSKAVSLGDRVVLDQERCILCSRCVRFCQEVTKTNELGIFNRGDRSVLATFEGRPMNNNYSINTVDICPVGALTSKDFRFKQRVWFLEDFDSTCPGCATGCSVKVSYNKSGVFRIRPRVDHDVNGFWMCDEGRNTYKHTNKEYRLEQVVERNDELGGVPMRGKPMPLALQEVSHKLAEIIKTRGATSIACIVTAQYTNEEYEVFFDYLVHKLGVKSVYYWRNNEKDFESFDGLLLRGDKNPNTQGLLQALKKFGLKGTMKDFEKDGQTNQFALTIVLGPENQESYPDIDEKIKLLSNAGDLIWLTACKNEALNVAKWQIPTKSFVEKDGTFTNFKGLSRKIISAMRVVPEAVSLQEFVKGISEGAAS